MGENRESLPNRRGPLQRSKFHFLSAQQHSPRSAAFALADIADPRPLFIQRSSANSDYSVRLSSAAHSETPSV